MMENKIKHVAFIMDGNGRWAKKQGKKRFYGHLIGSQKITEVCEWCLEQDIKIASFYAFSTENWARPKDEVNFIFSLIEKNYKKELKRLTENEIKVVHVGSKKNLPPKTKKLIQDLEEKTKNFNKFTLLFCFNYSGRFEIYEGIKKILKDYEEGKISIENFNIEHISNYLYTTGYPDPDLLIRTSGELRISNYYLYQLAYTELYFEPQLWPEYSKDHFLKALDDFYSRNRRFGKI